MALGGSSETVHCVIFTVEKTFYELVELLVDEALVGSEACPSQEWR